jgi:hypothetical protein
VARAATEREAEEVSAPTASLICAERFEWIATKV